MQYLYATISISLFDSFSNLLLHEHSKQMEAMKCIYFFIEDVKIKGDLPEQDTLCRFRNEINFFF